MDRLQKTLMIRDILTDIRDDIDDGETGSFIQIVRIKINYATNICHFLILPYDLFPEFKLTVLFMPD